MEWLRVPTAHVDGDDAGATVMRWRPRGQRLGWPRADEEKPFERYSLGDIAVYARGLAKEPPAWGTGWARHGELSRDGMPAAAIWRADDGSIFLPFDPDDAIFALQSESYLSSGSAAPREAVKGLARKAYYRVRPLLPRSAQLSMRRMFSRVQRRQRFPAWPAETALHDLVDRLLQFAAEVADEPVPWLAPWPTPYTWALVLTHDVESGVGYSRIDAICEQEAALGYRSAWNLVPQRDYAVEDDLVARLWNTGWEVGVHGLHHDGRDLESERLLHERLPEIRQWAERWKATGFRAPATQRAWSLMPVLGFDYDSSYPDTDPFEPQGGGCCSWLPFFNGDLLELPITLPQDHTLFAILRERDAARWIEKAALLRERGGMALLDTHPDYLGDKPAASAYLEFLKTYTDDASVWRALPSDVAAWWRRRAATSVERDGETWRIVGAAENEVTLAFASPQAA
jgi:hypothetical protein